MNTLEAQAQKYGTYLVDGEKLTRQEKYVLDQTEKGEIADLLSLIPDQDRREQIAKLGLAAYVEQLNDKDREAFLKEYGDRLLIRPRFLELLLIKGSGFPGFKIHPHGVTIANAFIKDPLDFEGAEVEHSFWLAHSILQGKASFRGSWFKKDLVLIEAMFQAEADFGRVKVGENLFLREAHYYGPVNFVSADIKGIFDAAGAQFLNKEQTASFSNMKVGDIASFEKARFQGTVIFSAADINGQFIAKEAQFLNEKAEANFNSMKVGQIASFEKAKFQGPVNFGSADIKSQFVAIEAQFLNKEQTANFNSMKVRQNAFFEEAQFQGAVNFGGADIKRQFVANEAKFLNKEQTANFNSMKVGHSAHFEKAQFKGPVNFVAADIKSNFEANEAQFLNKEQTAIFNSMKVGQAAIFYHATFQGPVDFRFCSFQNFQFIDMTYQSVYLEGLTYRNIIFGEDWKNTLKLLESSPDNHAQPYTQLAAFFQQSGQPDRADKTFIRGKRRELSQKSWLNPARWLTYIFWEKLAGYGRKPARTLFLIIPLVLIGAWLFELQFNIKFMETQSSFWSMVLQHRNIARFILSLDRFLPGVDLGLAKYWAPFQLNFWIWLYWFFLKIMGWITIPITLAAIYTKIK